MASKWTTKTYVVQKADRAGNLLPEILGVKLTYSAAHAVAKANAPAKVLFAIADKDDVANPPVNIQAHPDCN